MANAAVYTCGIVEDEELAYELLSKFIRRADTLKVLWRETSSKNLSAKSHCKVDIVFLDLLDSPLSNVAEIDQCISQYGNIIITTAHTEVYIKSLGIKYVAVLNKPFSYQIFENVVHEALSKISY
ncbi:hypothetical protein [Mucilaginibacter sp. KACC 22063]|uniref:hypothetical protein n=1 Tax=Mucilaginibacter sp. KACC 22063 TaxID=3025666 RepID=UPI00236612E5|nr:hypothetical protein [Mucilaginibacter sp. KACC 22063]WDF56027.1 hypothetical protein PQ461_03000 [Mucilaginibacter sp. KACC 22063]